MSADTLNLFAAAVLSLVFGYFPKLKDWYASLDNGQKRLIMALVLFVVSGAIFGLSCWKMVPSDWKLVTCDIPGLVGLVRAYILAVVANQGIYMLFVRKPAES